MAATPVGFVPGTYLDIFATDIKPMNAFNPGEFPLPQSLPSGSVTLTPTNTFNYDEVQKHEETRKYTLVRSSLAGVRYSGSIKFQLTGTYGFQLSVDNKHDGYNRVCSVSLFLDGKRVLTTRMPRQRDANVNQATVSITSGYYNYALYEVCQLELGNGGAGELNFSQISIDLRMAAPGDRAPRPIPIENFFIKAEN